jgi:hypothetical protein
MTYWAVLGDERERENTARERSTGYSCTRRPHLQTTASSHHNMLHKTCSFRARQVSMVTRQAPSCSASIRALGGSWYQGPVIGADYVNHLNLRCRCCTLHCGMSGHGVNGTKSSFATDLRIPRAGPWLRSEVQDERFYILLHLERQTAVQASDPRACVRCLSAVQLNEREAAILHK